jgi:hypothetical protein
LRSSHKRRHRRDRARCSACSGCSFSRGIVDGLNQILFGTTTPPTFFVGPFNFVPAGDETTISSSTLTPGTHLFICAIHPWMHETVVVH